MTAELHFFDAIVRAGAAHGEDWSRRIVDAAVDALVGGLDSPSLRMLAGQPNTEEAMTERILAAACKELGIPYPPRGERWVPQVIEGRRWERIASDSISCAVEPVEGSASGAELRISINGAIVSDSLIGWLDPVDIDYFAGADPVHRPLLSRCPTCGEPGCDWVQVHRSPDGQTVHWDWIDEAPSGADAGVSFPAEQYDSEIERFRSDRAWERPEDTVRRLVVAGVDHEALRLRGLRLENVARDSVEPSRIEVSVSSHLEPGLPRGAFQASVRFPWDGADVETIAQEIIRVLARNPREWRACYFMNNSDDGDAVPAMAGPLWKAGARRPRQPALEKSELGPIASDPKWRVWLDAYVFDSRTRDVTLREIENVDTRADNAKIIARSIAAASIIALGAGMLIGTVALSNAMHDPPLWSRLLLLAFGLIAVAGLGLSMWREGGRHVEGIEITRARKIEAAASDRTRMLPRTVLSDFYVSDRARDADIWDAAQQMHALNAAWAEHSELAGRPNLTLWQEIQLIEAEESARAVTEAIGELLNPGSVVEQPQETSARPPDEPGIAGLETAGPWVHHHTAQAADEVRSRAADQDALIIELDGAAMPTAEDLFREYADAFSFPDYFGANWPAFHECMTELADVPATSYLTVIRRADLLLRADLGEMPTLLRLLDVIGQTWGRSFGLSSEWGGGEVPFHTVLVME